MKLEITTMANPPAWLNVNDRCYYARDYTSGGGYEASKANQLINNFKKSRHTENTNQWYYKNLAVRQFATELAGILPKPAVVTFVPTSKVKADPEYDPRFDMLETVLLRLRPDIEVETPIIRTASCNAVHTGGRRNPTVIKQNLQWQGFHINEPGAIYVIDDVITSGAHFRAMSDMINENCGSGVGGIFWGKTVWS